MEEITHLGGTHVVAVGIDPATKKAYPLSVNPATGATTTTTSEAVAGNISHGQVTVDTTGDLIVAARASRRGVIVVNHGTTNIFLGTQSVTAGNGLLLVGVAGQGIFIPTTAAVYGITASGSQAVSYMEVF